MTEPAEKKESAKKKAPAKGRKNGETEIEVGLGFTMSIGDYQSARVDAKIRKTILAETKGDVDEEFRKLWGVAEEQVDEKIEEIQTLYKGGEA